MVKPIYIPSPSEEQRLIRSLGVSKVEKLSINGDEADDKKVVVSVEHTPDYAPAFRGVCTDRYEVAVVEGSSIITIDKESCQGKKSNEKIARETDEPRWFSLQSLFISDVKPFREILPLNVAEISSLKNNLSGPFIWSLANPKMDPLRGLWVLAKSDYAKEVVKDAEQKFSGMPLPPVLERPVWRAFAVFLAPMEERLQNLVTKCERMERVQGAAPHFEKLFQTPNIFPPSERMNPYIAKSFDSADMEKMGEEVKSIIFSAYPFITEGSLDNLTQVVLAWISRRALFQAVAELQKERREKEKSSETSFADLSLVGPELSDTLTLPTGMEYPSLEEGPLQSALEKVLSKNEITREEIRELLACFQIIQWLGRNDVQTSGTFLLASEGLQMATTAPVLFDQRISANVIGKVVEAPATQQNPVLAKRLRFLFGFPPARKLKKSDTKELASTTKPLPWMGLNFNDTPSKESLFTVPPSKDKNSTSAEQEALRLVQTGIKSYSTLKDNADKPFGLETPAVFEIIFKLKRLRGRGLDADFGRALLEKLLQLGEGDYLELGAEAKQALTLAVQDFSETVPGEIIPPADLSAEPEAKVTEGAKAEVKAEEKKPEVPAQAFVAPPQPVPPSSEQSWYKEKWAWGTGAGVAAAVVGSALYFLLGGSAPTKPPVIIPPKPDPDGRTMPTEVGP